MISVGPRKTWVGLVLALALVLGYFAVSWMGDREPEAGPSAEILAGPRPTIVDIHPPSVPPGGTVVVRFDSSSAASEGAQVSGRIAGLELAALEVRGDEAVFRVPALAHGEAGLSVVVNGLESPPRPLSIEPLNYAKIMRNIVGGLALVVLGLLTLSRAFRHRAGATLRRRIGSLTRSMRSSLSFGAVIGGVTQTSTLAAALALPSAERHLLSFRSAVTLVLGAHLGAVAVGAVLPLAATREAPLVIAVGVILRLTASEKRGRSTAKLITGLGLLLYGAHTLRSGFAPLAEQPSWLLELRELDVGGPGGLLLTAVLGAAAAFVVQSPGVVFVVVLSVSQATSFLGVDQALAILVGTSAGSAMSTTLVSWPLGQTSRRVALVHGVLALATVVVMWLMIPWLPDVVAAVLGTDPTEIDRGKKILHPNVGLHLSVAFIAMQWLSTLLVLPAVAPLSRKLRPAHARIETRDIPASEIPIGTVVIGQKAALEGMQRALEGDKNAPAEVDAQLERTRSLADAHLGNTTRSSAATETLISILAVQQSLEQVRYTVARAARRGVRLDGEGGRFINELHAQLLAGFEDASTLLGGGGGPDIDELRRREIEINASEAAFREFLQAQIDASDDEDMSAKLLRMAELANGYETVGNQLYRLGLGLIPEEF